MNKEEPVESPEDSPEDSLKDSAESRQSNTDDQGPGWMPAIMAGTLILGMIGFVSCGVTTWMLFKKRTEFAIRTLEQTYIPSVEQSLLAREEKENTLKHLQEFTEDLKRGKYEDWQAGGVMTRLIRCPVFQWGDLSAVEAFIKKQPDVFEPGAVTHLSRLRQAAEIDKAVAIDFDHVLQPVLVYDDSIRHQSLMDPLTGESVAEVITRCKEVADRFSIEGKVFDDVWIDRILKRQIKAGIEQGAI